MTSTEETMTLGGRTTNQFIRLPNEIWLLILNNLDTPELFLCRQLNSLWKTETSKLLQKSSKISFDGSHYHGSSHPMTDLFLLQTLLQNSDKPHFPCTNFNFRNIILENENFQRFLDLFGPFIKTLSLSRYTTVSPTRSEGHLFVTLHKLLTQQAGHIEDFRLDYHMTPNSARSRNSTLQLPPLPHLKHLTQGQNNGDQLGRIMNELIVSAVNLESFSCTRLDPHVPLDTLKSQGKLDTIKEI